MAFRRSLALKAKLYTQQQFSLSFAYLRHENDDHSKIEAPKFHRISKRGFTGSRSNNLLGFVENRRSSHIPFLALNDSISVRHMSSLIEEFVKVVEEAAEQASDMSSAVVAATDSLFPVAGLQHLIGGVHDFTGLNWWASIAVTTIIVRALMIPLMINHPLKDFFKLFGSRPAAAELREKHMSPILREYDFPFRTRCIRTRFIRWSVWLCFPLAIANMAEKIPSFTSGGALWFTDLTTADPFYILPVLAGFTYLIRIESDMPYYDHDVSFTLRLRNEPVFGAILIPFFCGFQEGFYFYWITSNVFMIIFKLALQPRRDKVSLLRKALQPHQLRKYTSREQTDEEWQICEDTIMALWHSPKTLSSKKPLEYKKGSLKN